jgi:hypothetical protein
MLVLNYLDGAYSFYDDSYTCLGYYQSTTDLTWATATFKWESAGSGVTWSSGLKQADFPSIVAGNQQGFVMILDQSTVNDKSLYITAITQAAQAQVTCPNHNLSINPYGTFVKFTEVYGMTGINDLVGKVIEIVDANNFKVDIDTTAMAAYTVGGRITILSNFQISTKRFNPYYAAGQKVRANYADFYLEKTAAGAFTVDIYVDDSYDSAAQSFVISTTQNYGITASINKIWQRAYPDVMGQYLQMDIYLSENQMRTAQGTTPETYKEADPEQSDFVLHAINFWMAPSGRLFSYDTVI